jgi:hypothetical protein
VAAVAAMTSAISSPTKRTRSRASTGRSGTKSFCPPRPGGGCIGGSVAKLISAISRAVNTAITPDCARAALMSIQKMRACARSERRKAAACACPSRFQSLVYGPRR